MKNKEKQYHPPTWATRFLRWYCKPELAEEIEGDILEHFHAVLKGRGKRQADLVFCLNVLGFLKPFAIRKFSVPLNRYTMMQANYYKVAFRTIRKDKINSLISVFGLVLAFTASMLIYRITNHELAYDSFHTKSNEIYRVIIEAKRDDVWQAYPSVGPPLGPAIKSFYPEIEEAVRFRDNPSRILATENGDKAFYEEKIFYADPAIFKVFTYPFRSGDPATALSNSSGIVLTSQMATKYFGKRDPLGQTLLLDNEIPFTVTGVLEPVPANTHFEFDFLLPFKAFKVPSGYTVTLDDFGWTSFHTYIKLAEDADPDQLVEKLPTFAATHFNEDQVKRLKYDLVPLSEIYFSELRDEKLSSGNKQYIQILISIGVLLLILAAFNFTNISVARSLTRAKETGMRKSLGSNRFNLILRYLSEPIIIVLFAFFFSLVMLPQLLDQLAIYFNLSIRWEERNWLEIAMIFLPMALIIGILSGLYPAFVMSSYKPSVMLRGIIHRATGGLKLQKTLVTLQYVITAFLLVSSFLFSSQVDFLRSKDLGFVKDEILLLKMPGETLNQKYGTIKTILEKTPGIASVSVGGGRMDGENGDVPVLAEGMEEAKNLPIDAVREDFYKTIGVKMVAGREFSIEFPSDSAEGVIINREAAKYFGWNPDEALGKKISVSGLAEGNVIGVVENFHNASLHNTINPLVVYYPRTLLQDIYVRVNAGEAHSLIERINADWNQIAPDVPFDFVFLNEHLQQMYQRDMQFSKLVNIFALLTIFISVLGLYGLISIVSKQRIKEISIRKVLGAPFAQLIYTLSRSFLSLIILANIIAWPVVIWIANMWLSQFAYHVHIEYSIFIYSLLITLFVSGVTLFLQSRKVAVLNPADTLKQE